MADIPVPGDLSDSDPAQDLDDLTALQIASPTIENEAIGDVQIDEPNSDGPDSPSQLDTNRSRLNADGGLQKGANQNNLPVLSEPSSGAGSRMGLGGASGGNGDAGQSGQDGDPEAGDGGGDSRGAGAVRAVGISALGGPNGLAGSGLGSNLPGGSGGPAGGGSAAGAAPDESAEGPSTPAGSSGGAQPTAAGASGGTSAAGATPSTSSGRDVIQDPSVVPAPGEDLFGGSSGPALGNTSGILPPTPAPTPNSRSVR